MSAQRKGGWGSLLSGAVAGLESRLDTILADDDQASAKNKTTEAAAEKQRLQIPRGTVVVVALTAGIGGPRSPSPRARPNSRLQDRLAKAVNKSGDKQESRPSSELGSRPESPALRSPGVVSDAGRTSIDSRSSEPATENVPPGKGEETKEEDPSLDASPRPSAEEPITLPPLSVVSEQPASMALPTMTIPSIVTPQTSSPRQSLDSTLSRPSIEISLPRDVEETAPRDTVTVEAELTSLQKTHDETVREHREELHSHLERIDALQSKLTFLAQQLASSAKAASADSETSPTDKKLAEKDAQITALLEEGQKLSKTEMKHLTTIKKMRTKAQETDKEITVLKQRLSKAEKSIGEQTDRAKRAETAEKAAQDKLKIVGKIEKDIEMIKAEREEAGLTIAELRRQLSDAASRAEDAEKRVQAGALEAEKRVTASLQEDIENIRIEKKLAEDRGKREVQEAREEAKRQQERAQVLELELRGEITNLETKLELLRSRSEEVSSSATGDTQAQLLRQIETLQTQYALASENWQGIESTLTSRVAALEKDRDETAKRESDIRRKARDVNSKARRLEDELEGINDRARALEQDLNEQRTTAQKLQARLAQAETAAQDARADLEREKKVWEADYQQRLDEEKSKWRIELTSPTFSHHLRAESPSTLNRRHSPDPLGIHNRRGMPRSVSGMEMPLSPMDRMLEEARRPSSSRQKSTPNVRTPEFGTPQRQNSIPTSFSHLNGATMSNTPSIAFDHDHEEAFENTSSPHRTINDMISVSTVGAGPSVQLVERMSAAVRRLESEKATSKEEMARLNAQRDEAREEVVALMREIEEKRAQDQKVEKLEKDLEAMDQRYQTTLEMLGEKSELVDELQSDVADLKKIYRDLVSTMK
ncbi:TATA element modulatory factor 1 TATA binding-domain-containing protein [Massariosphaeria phaeospora]|uniref:TATA element modulatory factor 1 TATA binding-domain-containing protein n=1 Tax=Massariosphaeria phaeospora TaxID=100035 RepID=A0A7C8I795_9PLEO|nr:TATA element modulatory factor 1 TATA binding-domain-containing protein [Massariosphaeria phaeospora]